MTSLKERRDLFFMHAAQDRALIGALVIQAANQSYIPNRDVALLRVHPEFGWVDEVKEGDYIVSVSRELIEEVLMTSSEAYEIIQHELKARMA